MPKNLLSEAFEVGKRLKIGSRPTYHWAITSFRII